MAINPLVDALKKRNQGPMRRMIIATQNEVPEIQSAKPGDPIDLSVSGRILSINSDGLATIELTSVQSDSSEENQESDSLQPQPIHVVTQQSHA